MGNLENAESNLGVSRKLTDSFLEKRPLWMSGWERVFKVFIVTEGRGPCERRISIPHQMEKSFTFLGKFFLLFFFLL